MLLIAISLSIIFLDQLLKFIFTNALTAGQSIPLIKGIFHITLIRNTGAAFGILKNQTVLFVVLSVAAILSIFYYLPRLDRNKILTRLALSLILGGAVSNLTDRIRFGYVIDYLDFRIWPVFNIADSAITIGAVLLILKILYKK